MLTPAFMRHGYETSAAFAAGDSEERGFAAALARDGVAVFDPEIDDFNELSADIAARVQAAQPGAGRLQDAWRRFDSVRRLATCAKVLRLLQFAYGRRPIPFQTLNFTVGTQQPLHSDTIHFDSFPQHFMCGVWVALEDADAGNGALQYVPGSHRLPIMALEDFGLSAGGYFTRNHVGEQYEAALRSYVAVMNLPTRTIPLKKGQAVVWAANLFHGGGPITQPGRTRLSQVTHYYFDDCLYTQPLWSNLHGGRIMYKKVYDIAARRYVTPTYNGRRFRLPLEAHLREFLVAKILVMRRS